MASHIGNKLKIEADDGEYVGILRSIDSNNGRLSMDGVTCLDSGRVLTGMNHFYSKEIHNVVVIEQKRPSKSIVTDDERGNTILASKLNPRHLRKLKDIDRNRILLSKQGSSGDEAKTIIDSSPRRDAETGVDCNDSTAKSSNPPPNIPYNVIDQLDSAFTEAIEHIRAQSLVGLSCEGVDIGRHGQLCWLNIATKSYNLLFDVVSLGPECFDRGLSEIIQSSTIQKVIHDCRKLSDLFFHTKDIKLVNVFDTQVASVMIYRSMTDGDLPRYTESLSGILLHSLNLNTDMVQVTKIRESNKKGDEFIWRRRPATPELLTTATKNVMHLLELRLALMENMLKDFVTGVNMYLSTLRDTDDIDKHSQQMRVQHQLPPEFTVLAPRGRGYRSHDRSRYDENGFYENLLRTPDPYVKYSHDGVWHEGDGVIRQDPEDRNRNRSTRNDSQSRSRSRSRGRSYVSDDGGGNSVLSSATPGVHSKQSTTTVTNTPVPVFTETAHSPKANRAAKSDTDDSSASEGYVLIASGNESRSCLPKLSDRVTERRSLLIKDKKDKFGSADMFDCIPGQDSQILQREALAKRMSDMAAGMAGRGQESLDIQGEAATNKVPSPRASVTSRLPGVFVNTENQSLPKTCQANISSALAVVRGDSRQNIGSEKQSPMHNSNDSTGSPIGRGRGAIIRELLSDSETRSPPRLPGLLQSRLPRCAGTADSPELIPTTARLNNIRLTGPDKLDAQGNITLGRGHLRSK